MKVRDRRNPIEHVTGRVAVLPGHLLFRVEPGRVEAAAQAFEKAGFAVVRGGPPDDLVNAMIYFPDGWFIELFGLGPRARVVVPLFFARLVDPILAARFGRLVRSRSTGWLDWSVDVDDLENARGLLARGQVGVSPPRTFHRTQEDGSSVAWELAMPSAIEVPFLKSPYRGHRPIPASTRVHRCGAAGIRQLVFSTPEASLRRLRLLGDPSASDPLRIGGLQVTVEPGSEVALRRVSFWTARREPAQVEVELDGGWQFELVPFRHGAAGNAPPPAG